MLMGQHFLRSSAVLKKIIAAANLSGQETVLEIGPGLGALTLELARKAGQVVAVEKDKRLAAALEEKLKKEKIYNVRLITGDILKIPISQFLNFAVSYQVVANIPYYLTSRLIRLLLESDCPPQEMLLMVQKEVAERIIAKPPKMNLLALGVQLYGRPEIIAPVPAGAFSPKPRVDSAILRIRMAPKNFFHARGIDPADFFAMLRTAFAHRRKTLTNNLAAGLGRTKPEILRLLHSAGVPPKARAEALTIGDWENIFQRLRV